MHRSSQPDLTGGAKVGLLVLAACTVWLVVQNTVLVMAMMWSEPQVAGRIAMAVVKAVALVGARFWTSPAAIALVAALFVALLLRGRDAEPRREVRHG